jgi:precorrin-6A/cobalt-precorrin-6A reductase
MNEGPMNEGPMNERPMNERRHVLVLGGTAEAVALANSAATAFDITYSLAGRTQNPALPENVAIRTGGFGGAGALASWIRENATDAVIDATHPFAAQITTNTAEACVAAGVPRLKLVRPAWENQPGDDWIPAANVTDAAARLSSLGKHAFLSVGRQEVAAFAIVAGTTLIIRSIDPPDDADRLPGAIFITGRGPFTIADEIALFRDHKTDVLVSKNAGGDATYAKIAAARELGLKVIMIGRPPVPAGDVVDSVDAALAWLSA